MTFELLDLLYLTESESNPIDRTALEDLVSVGGAISESMPEITISGAIATMDLEVLKIPEISASVEEEEMAMAIAELEEGMEESFTEEQPVSDLYIEVGTFQDDLLFSHETILDNLLYGGPGNDTLTSATRGCDQLWGGAGVDRFVIFPNLVGHVRVEDSVPGEVIAIHSSGLTTEVVGTETDILLEGFAIASIQGTVFQIEERSNLTLFVAIA